MTIYPHPIRTPHPPLKSLTKQGLICRVLRYIYIYIYIKLHSSSHLSFFQLYIYIYIYIKSKLGTTHFAHKYMKTSHVASKPKLLKTLARSRDLNPRPSDYMSNALPSELSGHVDIISSHTHTQSQTSFIRTQLIWKSAIRIRNVGNNLYYSLNHCSLIREFAVRTNFTGNKRVRINEV